MTPRRIIVVPLDEPAELRLDTATAEDEMTLRRWLRQPAGAKALLNAVTSLLEDVDRAA